MVNGHSSKLYKIKNTTNEQTIECEKDVYTYNGLKLFTHQISVDLELLPFDEEQESVNDYMVSISLDNPTLKEAYNQKLNDIKEYLDLIKESDLTGKRTLVGPSKRGIPELESDLGYLETNIALLKSIGDDLGIDTSEIGEYEIYKILVNNFITSTIHSTSRN